MFNPEGDPNKGEEIVLANPRIISTAKTTNLGEEACLSFKHGGDIVKGDVEVCTLFVLYSAFHCNGSQFVDLLKCNRCGLMSSADYTYASMSSRCIVL